MYFRFIRLFLGITMLIPAIGFSSANADWKEKVHQALLYHYEADDDEQTGHELEEMGEPQDAVSKYESAKEYLEYAGGELVSLQGVPLIATQWINDSRLSIYAQIYLMDSAITLINSGGGSLSTDIHNLYLVHSIAIDENLSKALATSIPATSPVGLIILSCLLLLTTGYLLRENRKLHNT